VVRFSVSSGPAPAQLIASVFDCLSPGYKSALVLFTIVGIGITALVPHMPFVFVIFMGVMFLPSRLLAVSDLRQDEVAYRRLTFSGARALEMCPPSRRRASCSTEDQTSIAA